MRHRHDVFQCSSAVHTSGSEHSTVTVLASQWLDVDTSPPKASVWLLRFHRRPVVVTLRHGDPVRAKNVQAKVSHATNDDERLKLVLLTERNEAARRPFHACCQPNLMLSRMQHRRRVLARDQQHPRKPVRPDQQSVRTNDAVSVLRMSCDLDTAVVESTLTTQTSAGRPPFLGQTSRQMRRG